MEKHNVIIYSTPTCHNCAAAKKYFNENNIEFKNIDVSNNSDAIEEMVKKSGQMGVPVIDIDGNIVVGFKKTILSNLLGFSSDTDMDVLIANGALILDVRTVAEYQYEHKSGSINIPLDKLESQISKLDKDDVIIVCCETGSRSGVAKIILEKNGFKKVHNGGNCNNLKESEGGGVCSVT